MVTRPPETIPGKKAARIRWLMMARSHMMPPQVLAIHRPDRGDQVDQGEIDDGGLIAGRPGLELADGRPDAEDHRPGAQALHDPEDRQDAHEPGENEAPAHDAGRDGALLDAVGQVVRGPHGRWRAGCRCVPSGESPVPVGPRLGEMALDRRPGRRPRAWPAAIAAGCPCRSGRRGRPRRNRGPRRSGRRCGTRSSWPPRSRGRRRGASARRRGSCSSATLARMPAAVLRREFRASGGSLVEALRGSRRRCRPRSRRRSLPAQPSRGAGPGSAANRARAASTGSPAISASRRRRDARARAPHGSPGRA